MNGESLHMVGRLLDHRRASTTNRYAHLDNPWVITGRKEGDHLKNLDAIWLRLRARAGLEDVRLHDCRHSFASRALALSEGLPAIGHRKVTTAARYAQLERDTEKASMAKIGGSIGADLLGGTGAA